MNHITNDYGTLVVAEGAPGSIASAKCQYPKLIDRISYLHMDSFSYHHYNDDEIVRELIDAGIDSTLEVESVVAVVLGKLIPDFPGDKMKHIPQMFLHAKRQLKG